MKNILQSFSLSGKNALIVCPENPYGVQIAAGLFSAGAKLWLAGPCEAALKEAQQALAAENAAVEGFFVYDHCTKEQTLAMAESAKAAMGSIDILVENSLNTTVTGWDQDFATIHAQLQKTHLGTMLTVQAIGTVMGQQKQGAVLLVTDYGALVGYDIQNYGESTGFDGDFSLVKGFIKGGAVNYARQSAGFLGENGCRCNAIAYAPPAGSIDEGLQAAITRHSHLKRPIKPEEIASAAVFLCSDAAGFVTGITLAVDGGYTAK